MWKRDVQLSEEEIAKVTAAAQKYSYFPLEWGANADSDWDRWVVPKKTQLRIQGKLRKFVEFFLEDALGGTHTVKIDRTDSGILATFFPKGEGNDSGN